MPFPRIALTMGDAAGIGPEVIARACTEANLRETYRPLIVGDPEILDRALRLIGADESICVLESLADSCEQDDVLFCWDPRAADESSDLSSVPSGSLDGRCGKAACDWLIAATRAALERQVDAIVTAPLNKASLKLAGLNYPGHTEILAEICGASKHAMMLFVPPGKTVKSPQGLGVAHVSLHTSLASVPDLVTTQNVRDKIELLHDFLCRIGIAQPRIGVCALNPHAGEEGLFGNEESEIIQPAVHEAVRQGISAEGPIPADAVFRRAIGGEFDGVVAMYHDQGHIPIKLVARDNAVNITLGLPIIRTSPSHGTAFDIAWKGIANPEGMIAAIRTAALLARRQKPAPSAKDWQGETRTAANQQSLNPAR